MTNDSLFLLQGIFGSNYLGLEQINKLLLFLNMPPLKAEEIPSPDYSIDFLKEHSKNYLLILGCPGTGNDPLNILKLRNTFGMNPDKGEPCFYNQDWYVHEAFVLRQLTLKWYLLKRDIIEDSRAVMPNDLLKHEIQFPPAILCAYAFFAMSLSYGYYLWYHDFVWCEDLDHNGDRIYVGKYHDIDCINKNGFSIHRHLSLRPCYASVDLL